MLQVYSIRRACIAFISLPCNSTPDTCLQHNVLGTYSLLLCSLYKALLIGLAEAHLSAMDYTVPDGLRGLSSDCQAMCDRSKGLAVTCCPELGGCQCAGQIIALADMDGLPIQLGTVAPAFDRQHILRGKDELAPRDTHDNCAGWRMASSRSCVTASLCSNSAWSMQHRGTISTAFLAPEAWMQDRVCKPLHHPCVPLEAADAAN